MVGHLVDRPRQTLAQPSASGTSQKIGGGGSPVYEVSDHREASLLSGLTTSTSALGAPTSTTVAAIAEEYPDVVMSQRRSASPPPQTTSSQESWARVVHQHLAHQEELEGHNPEGFAYGQDEENSEHEEDPGDDENPNGVYVWNNFLGTYVPAFKCDEDELIATCLPSDDGDAELVHNEGAGAGRREGKEPTADTPGQLRLSYASASGAYRCLISPESVHIKEATEYERNRNIAQIALTVLSPSFLVPMVQRLPEDFTIEFGPPATWKFNYKVFGDDATNEEEMYTPPPFEKTKSASTTPTLNPSALFSAGASGSGAAAAQALVVTPVVEADDIVAAAINLRENVAPAKGKASKGKAKIGLRPASRGRKAPKAVQVRLVQNDRVLCTLPTIDIAMVVDDASNQSPPRIPYRFLVAKVVEREEAEAWQERGYELRLEESMLFALMDDAATGERERNRGADAQATSELLPPGVDLRAMVAQGEDIAVEWRKRTERLGAFAYSNGAEAGTWHQGCEAWSATFPEHLMLCPALKDIPCRLRPAGMVPARGAGRVHRCLVSIFTV
ncbi:hypothetical protein CYMTET_55035 [Cymbomonas tetramitiformis]|uniref:Uncharacterized protein n=1 Tax=Cymbomonas tetramitiformis TaxID=36881 RepID=A0AAE0BFI9_9CHLO|nr:hypothetical protein CYMTET_55035 [Cymbomonas tetramitiformis]